MDITRCSFCTTRKALPDHYLCRKCRDNAPWDLVFAAETARLPYECMPDYVQRMRRNAHEGQTLMRCAGIKVTP